MNKTFAAIFAALALAVTTTAIAQPAGPITLPAKPGNVTFDHAKHKALKCTDCHADAKGGDIKGIGSDMDKDLAHKACVDCHKKEAKGPQKCAECHVKAK